MPGDSILIRHGDTIYIYNGTEGLPPVRDSIPFLSQLDEKQINTSYDTGKVIDWPVPLVLFLIFLIVLIVAKFYRIINAIEPVGIDTPGTLAGNSYQVFKGTKLHFEPALVHTILDKYFIYYKELCAAEQERFLNRLQAFVKAKIYMIPAAEGYREMPILTSASAIQLTFGLKDFMLPWYEYIRVHPKEYIMINPLRTLAGNVSGKTITLSWKHFLEDYQKKDGVNVGLHEMAHALQMQHEYFYKQKGDDFRRVYDLFESLDEHIRRIEKSSESHVYTDYALTSTDEFWASSVEIFFEQPAILKLHYPPVYEIILKLLKQDPFNSSSNPCVVD